MKQLTPRTAQALRELMEHWNRALSEPVPQDMLELVKKLQ